MKEQGEVPDPSGKPVGELEATVLRVLWECGETATPGVYESVGKPRGLAYTTILTVLQRLHRKGFVKRREMGKGHLYTAAISRQVFAERRAHLLANEVMALGPAGVAAFFAEASRLDPELLERARLELETDG